MTNASHFIKKCWSCSHFSQYYFQANVIIMNKFSIVTYRYKYTESHAHSPRAPSTTIVVIINLIWCVFRISRASNRRIALHPDIRHIITDFLSFTTIFGSRANNIDDLPPIFLGPIYIGLVLLFLSDERRTSKHHETTVNSTIELLLLCISLMILHLQIIQLYQEFPLTVFIKRLPESQSYRRRHGEHDAPMD
jgi:hypothetical protein